MEDKEIRLGWKDAMGLKPRAPTMARWLLITSGATGPMQS